MTAPARETSPVSNFLALGASEIVARGIGFVATALLARRLGVASFGVLGFATAVTSYFGLALTGGFGDIGAREVARNPTRVREIAADGTLVRLLIAMAGACGILLFALLVAADDVRTVLLLSILSLFSLGLQTTWVYRGVGRSGVSGASLLITQVCYLAGVLLFVRTPADVARVPVVQFVGELVGALLLLGMLFGFAVPKASLARGLRLLRQSRSATASRMLRTLIVTFDVVLLGFLATRRDVGLYTAAYRICYPLTAIAVSTHIVYLPSTTRAATAGPEHVSSILERSLALTAAVVLPLVAGGIVLAGPLLGLFFGAEYSEAATAFRILLASIALLAFHGTTHSIFVALHRTRLEAGIFGAGAALNVILNLILIPSRGLIGAALATLAAETLILVAVVVALAQLGIRPSLGHVKGPLGAAMVMGALLILVSNMAPPVLLVVAGGLLYAGILGGSGWLRKGLREAAVDSPVRLYD